MRAVLKKVGYSPRVIEIEDKWEVYRDLVDGWIEMIHMPFDDNVICVCNEEGKLVGKPANLIVPEYEDIFVGDLVFVADNGDGTECSLTDEQIGEIETYIKEHEVTPERFTEFIRYLRNK